MPTTRRPVKAVPSTTRADTGFAAPVTLGTPQVISSDIDPTTGYYSIINRLTGAERFYLNGYFGTNAMIANLKKYDPQYKGGYPSFGATGACLAAQLGIKGLQVAGQNPTRDSFIKNLTQVTGWDAN